ncbi:MAG: metal ABC transporter solute-binding protein, Zn/Mn family [Candidatus Muiribacteriaceae bacterium]
MKKLSLIIFLMIISVCVFPVDILVSIQPQKYIVENIVGNRLRVHSLLEEGDNPHLYEPTPGDLLTASEADVFFAINIEFEHSLIPKIKGVNTDLRIVDISSVLDKISMSGHGDHDHSHGRKDPHVWLSPANNMKMAGAYMKVLCEMWPEHTDYFKTNTESLIVRTNKIAIDIRTLLSGNIKQRDFFIFHPAWGYFADEFGLVQHAVEVEGKEPGPAQLAALIKKMEAQNARVLVVKKGNIPSLAHSLSRSLDLELVELDPLAYDVNSNLMKSAERLRKALR